jgi:hypothetical protein
VHTSSQFGTSVIEVPYKARVLPGSLDYNHFDTYFLASMYPTQVNFILSNVTVFVHQLLALLFSYHLSLLMPLDNTSQAISRELVIRNLFSVPVSLYSVDIIDRHFNVLNVSCFVKPGNENYSGRGKNESC